MYRALFDCIVLISVVASALYLGYSFGYHSALYDLRNKKSHSIKE